jgi:hypothetical protein
VEIDITGVDQEPQLHKTTCIKTSARQGVSAYQQDCKQATHRARQIDQAYRERIKIATPKVQARVLYITTDHIHRRNGDTKPKPGATAKHPGY